MSTLSVLKTEIKDLFASIGQETNLSGGALSSGTPLSLSLQPTATTKFCISVTAGSDTTGTITLTGLLAAAAQTENITISGTGKYYSTKSYDSINASGITTTNVNCTISVFSQGWTNYIFSDWDAEEINPQPVPTPAGTNGVLVFTGIGKPSLPKTNGYNANSITEVIDLVLIFKDYSLSNSETFANTLMNQFASNFNIINFETKFPLSYASGLVNYEVDESDIQRDYSVADVGLKKIFYPLKFYFTV